MSEIEILEEEIEKIKLAYTNIIDAMDNLVDVDNTDAEYKQLDKILESLDDIVAEKRVELENLEEQAMFDENEEQWEGEQKEQYHQYWSDAI